MRKVISTNKAPAAIGPYAQANVQGNFVFTSGQIAINPESVKLVEGGIQEQTRQALDNLKEVLLEARSDLDKVLKTTCFLANMDDFAAMNQIYAEYFGEGNYPSRSAVQVGKLPMGALVEIEAIGYIQE